MVMQESSHRNDMCWDSWGCKELDASEGLNWTEDITTK